jgi:hypothetical protein
VKEEILPQMTQMAADEEKARGQFVCKYLHHPRFCVLVMVWWQP